MIQTKCRNGHYFDREEFIYCPICGSEAIDAKKSKNVNHKKGHFRIKNKCLNGHTLDSYEYNICPVCGTSTFLKPLDYGYRIIKLKCKNEHYYDGNQYKQCPICHLIGEQVPEYEDVSIRFTDINKLIIERLGHHYELDAKTYQLSYCNVIDPAFGGRKYPNDYFIRKTAVIDNKTMEEITALFDFVLKKQRLITRLPETISLGSRALFIRIVTIGQSYMFIEKNEDMIPEEFKSIIKIFDKFAVFPDIGSDLLSF